MTYKHAFIQHTAIPSVNITRSRANLFRVAPSIVPVVPVILGKVLQVASRRLLEDQPKYNHSHLFLISVHLSLEIKLTFSSKSTHSSFASKLPNQFSYVVPSHLVAFSCNPTNPETEFPEPGFPYLGNFGENSTKLPEFGKSSKPRKPRLTSIQTSHIYPSIQFKLSDENPQFCPRNPNMQFYTINPNYPF